MLRFRARCHSIYQGINVTKNTIYLASQSPRRQQLLQQLGLHAQVMPAHIDEAVIPGEPVVDYVMRLARQKAETGRQLIQQQQLASLPILAADTVVCLEGRILGKPKTDEMACAMLQSLSGRWHEVHTAVAVAAGDGIELAVASSEVEVAELSAADILAYVASGEPRDKAGAYGIQGLAAIFIKRLHGSYSGVMGLPLFETARLLRNAGVALLKHE